MFLPLECLEIPLFQRNLRLSSSPPLPSSISLASCSSPITSAAPSVRWGIPADQTELGGWRDAAVFVFAVPGFGLMYN